MHLRSFSARGQTANTQEQGLMKLYEKAVSHAQELGASIQEHFAAHLSIYDKEMYHYLRLIAKKL